MTPAPGGVPRPDVRAPSTPLQRAVYGEILRSGPRPRTELAARFAVSGPTMTRVTRELLAAGLLREMPPVPGAKGRPQEPLEIAPDHARFLGVKITADEVYVEVTTARAEPREDVSRPLPDHAPQTVLSAIAELVEALAQAHPHVAGVGVAVGARVRDRREVVSSHLLGWPPGFPLAERLEAATGLPVTIENDLHALLHGVHWFGRGRRYDSFAVLTVGEGVGLGAVHGGRVLEGHTHLAGLTENFPTVLETAEGRRPLPLGAAVRTSALVDRARTRGVIGARDGIAQLRTAFAAGESGARTLVRESASAVGTALIGVVALLDPEAVLIGGENVDLLRAVEPDLRRVLDSGLEDAQRDLELRFLSPDFDDWARGAAVLAVQRFVEGVNRTGRSPAR